MNDILLAKNGTTGVAAIVDKDVVFDIYVSLALLRAREEILPFLLLYFVNSPVAKAQFNKRLKGSGVPNLHLEEIREVVISFPKSLAEQRAIVSKLDKVAEETQRLESLYQRKLAALAELKKSLLHQAFSGAL
jgi:type I restriction enzyme S subunit